MTRFENLYISLPCHSLEDFPTDLVGKKAENLLSAWTVLWHPQLIASARSAPQWFAAEETPTELERTLVVVPTCSTTIVESDLRQKCEQAGAMFVDQDLSREELEKLILDQMDSAPIVEAEIVADFFALGYSYLQVQLMTRQLRYSSSLDEQRFSELLVTAADTATTANSAEETKAELQLCFDLLLEERNSYYPVQANLIDYTLLAETTLGSSLRKQLARPYKSNVLLTGSLAETINNKHPETRAAIRKAIEAEQLDLIGMHQSELPAPLVSRNTIVRDLQIGRKKIHEAFGVTPEVFARRTTGLCPALPEILEKMSVEYALLSSLDEGRNPASSSASIRWEAPSGEMVVALAQSPVDTNRPESFLKLAISIGEAIDNEHCAFVLLAHWPSRHCSSFEDFVRAQQYGPLFGNFCSFSECFATIYDPGYGESYSADEYRNAYLKQAIAANQPNPISRYVDYWQRTAQIASLENLLLMAACLESSSVYQTAAQEIHSLSSRTDNDLTFNQNFEIDEQIDTLRDRLVADMAGNAIDDADSIMVLNTTHFARTQKIVSEGDLPNSGAVETIYLRASQNNETTWIVNCPSLGHATLSAKTRSKKSKPVVPVVDGYRMQNEHFRIAIDPETGGMRSLNLYSRRANMMTQRLAMRRFSGHAAIDTGSYSDMVATNVSVVADTPLSGLATATGNLIISGEKVGEFQQQIQVTRGSKLVRFEVEFEGLNELGSGDAWGNYVCNRFAWLDEAAKLTRGLHGVRCEITEQKICATNFIEIAEPDYQMTLLTGGLPYHQRIGRRLLDTLLVVPNESRRKFQFALSVNNPYAQQAATNWVGEPITLANKRPAGQTDSWLFHFNAKNIALTQSRCVFDETGKLSGVRFKLQETEGRRGDLKIRCPYQIKRAFLLNLIDTPIEELKVQGNQVQTDFLGSQMLDIKIVW